MYYHATSQKSLPGILARGLVPGSGEDRYETFSAQYHWPTALAHLYPVRPIYLSLYEPLSWMPEILDDLDESAELFRADVDGLTLLADLPSLSDEDVSFLETGIQLPSDWQEHECLYELQPWMGADRIIKWSSFEDAKLHRAIITVTNTVAVCQTVGVERLEVVDWQSVWPEHWCHLSRTG